MAKYEHRDADDRWHAFSDADNQAIEEAYRMNKNKILLTMPQNPPGLREFEVRFGDNARSERMPRPPSTKIIQVNVARLKSHPYNAGSSAKDEARVIAAELDPLGDAMRRTILVAPLATFT